MTWRHLIADGFDSGSIRRRVTSGQLVPKYPGVYVAGPAPLTSQGEDLAAVFAGGDGAILSDLSGAVRMGMLRYAPAERHVLPAIRGRRRPIAGVVVRQTRCLPPTDVTVFQGIPIATVPRILLDLAVRADVSDRALESAAAQAERDGRLDRATQLRLARRSIGWPGSERLRRILRAGPALLNAIRDLERDAAHRRCGRRVDAVTARQVREDPATVVAVAMEALRSRGWEG